MPASAHRLRKTRPDATATELELSIVMPCLNEAETIAVCIKKALRFLEDSGTAGEVVIADNGSTDGSRQIANALGARIVEVRDRGYGAALIGGIAAARGRFVAIGDADDSYDFLGLGPFVEQLRAGADLVMGNRFTGGIATGAMPRLHRYLGNPVLSFVGRLFFDTPIGDFHCGLRAFRRDSVARLGLAAGGMEFASEMVVKAAINGLDIREVPTTLRPDGRSRPPHLRTWRDGWRHLRFLLIYAPKWLFLLPGLMLCAPGLAGVLALVGGDVTVGDTRFGIHSMLFAAMAVIMGTQLLSFSVLARHYGIIAGFWPESAAMTAVRRLFTVERACLAGAAMILAAIALAVAATTIWAGAGYGAMNPEALMRIAIPAVLLGCVGMQTVFTAFFAGLLDQPRRS
ncbi:glycosyltransferase family 2 protein [Enterovirga sp. GCM10030262]|uniref:glycosyltransferase family 2 protein n=1 Tax=Enterovirga sp. GCM10030262 TaxID=3273391 RepID=UPI003607B782